MSKYLFSLPGTTREHPVRVPLFLLLSAALLLPGTGLSAVHAGETETENTSASDVYTLPVFGTSDIHGYVTSADPPYEYRAAWIADKVNDARGEGRSSAPDRTVLVDAGDIYEGTMLSGLVEGEVMSAVFDAMHYDAVTVGNHEFDWGISTLIDDNGTMRDYSSGGTVKENTVPFVCTNLYQDGEKAAFTRDFVILDKTAASKEGRELPVRIAVFGFVSDYAGTLVPSLFQDLGYSILYDLTQTERLASELEQDHACDASILLTHCRADKIAELLPPDTCFDLVIAGHTHEDLLVVTGGGVPVIEPAGQTRSYVSAEFKFEKDGQGSARLLPGTKDTACYNGLDDLIAEGKLYNTEENAADLDPEIIALTDEYLERIRPIVEMKIGYTTVPLTRDLLPGSGSRASTLANWLTDALMRASGADVAIINNAGMRAELMPDENGITEITLGDMYAMLPFDDMIYRFELTYGELADVFRYAMTGAGRSLLTRMSGIDCFFEEEPVEEGSDKVHGKNTLKALEKDGQLVWKDGVVQDGWKDKKVVLAVSEFVATTERDDEDTGLENPLCAYSLTDRLISNDTVLRDSVIKALVSEAKENDGLLHVDTKPHFICINEQ